MKVSIRISDMIAFVVGVLGVFLFFTPDPNGIPVGTMQTAGVVVITIGLLATAALPEYMTVLIFFFLCSVISIAPPKVIFSGFLSSAVWLVLGGMILGVGIESTGLGARLASYIERAFAKSYFKLIAGTVLIMCLLAILMPSSVGRVTIMLPIIIALADRLGFGKHSNGRFGLVLAVGVGALTPSFSILPASVPNVVMAGAAETIYGLNISYTEYFALHFPVIGLVTMLALPVFITILFPAKIKKFAAKEETARLKGEEVRLILILLFALGLWATDGVHGISPAWIALGAAIICSFPGIGIMPEKPLLSQINFGPILVLAGVIGIGGVVTETGLGSVIGSNLIMLMGIRNGTDIGTFASVVALGWSLEFLTTLPGQPAIMSSFGDTLSKATGWPLNAVLMAQVPAWGMLVFPYQAPPLIATRAISGLAIREFIRLLLPMAIFGWLVMVPLQWVWWKFIGYLPNV